jgi:RNA polymerase sigma factor (sigma-70 family)
MIKITYEKLESSLIKWGAYYANKEFDMWDLIVGAWLSGRLKRIKKPQYISKAVRWAMIDYMRDVRHTPRKRQYVPKIRARKRKYLFPEQLPDNYNISVQDQTYQSVNNKDLLDYLTRGFTKREKLIIKLRYISGYTMHEIGKIVDGTTAGNISLIHKRLLARIKEKLERQK